MRSFVGRPQGKKTKDKKEKKKKKKEKNKGKGPKPTGTGDSKVKELKKKATKACANDVCVDSCQAMNDASKKVKWAIGLKDNLSNMPGP